MCDGIGEMYYHGESLMFMLACRTTAWSAAGWRGGKLQSFAEPRAPFTSFVSPAWHQANCPPCPQSACDPPSPCGLDNVRARYLRRAARHVHLLRIVPSVAARRERLWCAFAVLHLDAFPPPLPTQHALEGIWAHSTPEKHQHSSRIMPMSSSNFSTPSPPAYAPKPPILTISSP